MYSFYFQQHSGEGWKCGYEDGYEQGLQSCGIDIFELDNTSNGFLCSLCGPSDALCGDVALL